MSQSISSLHVAQTRSQTGNVYWTGIWWIAFIDKCKRFKLEADGQIRKLDLLEEGLTFIRRRTLKDDPNNRTYQQHASLTPLKDGSQHCKKKKQEKNEKNGGTVILYPQSGRGG